MLIPGTMISIPASQLETRQSTRPKAWAGIMLTVQLDSFLEVIRVSPWELGLTGDWFAIDPGIQTRQEYASSHALPKPFRFQAICELHPGSILNVGRCAPFKDQLNPLLDQRGGGYQAEFLEGHRLPTVHPMVGVWSNRWGSA